MAKYHSYSQQTSYNLTRDQPPAIDHYIPFDRHSLFGQSGGHHDLRIDPTCRGYTIPTPIHDVEADNSQGARKRSQIACARCRKRKIKCSGDPGNATGCQACRSSGADVRECTFERVGTKFTFGVSHDPGGTPTTPTSAYGMTGFLSSISVESGSRPLTYPEPLTHGYDRASYSSIPLDPYGLEIAPANSTAQDPPFPDDHVWSTRASQNGTGYSPYNVQFGSLSTSTLQAPPPPVDRRLPAPNLVGTPSTSDSVVSPFTGVSGRLASLSLSSQGHQPEKSLVRPSPASNAASTGIMLPPVSRHKKTSNPPDYSHETGTQSYDYANPPIDNSYRVLGNAGSSSSRDTALPPLQWQQSHDSVYIQNTTPLSTSAPSITVLVATDDHAISRPSNESYSANNVSMISHNWATANRSTGRRPEATRHTRAEGMNQFTPIVPATPHAQVVYPSNARGLERHDKSQPPASLEGASSDQNLRRRDSSDHRRGHEDSTHSQVSQALV
ncbi:hypothetical protein AAFC00_000701 [Neodothiora populina]|uniref:Zn(2)-C6 fungal-type domain-containing protein n=1 Tax=Neodothiora populina TaxID=2781224 RepID=A0ABR3PEW6_9PEZI